MAELIYKILTRDEWAILHEKGRFDGGPMDRDHGFLHFSKAQQLKGTLLKHYSLEEIVAVVAVATQDVAADLRWEVSRGNDVFPHLYRPLTTDLVNAVEWVAPHGLPSETTQQASPPQWCA